MQKNQLAWSLVSTRLLKASSKHQSMFSTLSTLFCLWVHSWRILIYRFQCNKLKLALFCDDFSCIFQDMKWCPQSSLKHHLTQMQFLKNRRCNMEKWGLTINTLEMALFTLQNEDLLTFCDHPQHCWWMNHCNLHIPRTQRTCTCLGAFLSNTHNHNRHHYKNIVNKKEQN